MTDREVLVKRPYTREQHVAGLLRKAITPNMADLGLLANAAPGAGDAIGLLSDVAAMAQDPELRTPGNIGLSMLGALPFFPSGVIKLAPALKMRGGSVVPGKFGGMHFQILEQLKKLKLSDDDIIDDGFIDEAGKYYTRSEAMQAAKSADQSISTMQPDKLFSEDLILHHGQELPLIE